MNPITRIAEKGGVELKLVKRAIRGLLGLGVVKVMDLFHFQASYGLTGEWGWFVRDEKMVEECQRYVCASAGDGVELPAKERIFALYAALGSSQSVHDFVLAQHSLLAEFKIDVRRFVTFGVLKGFLRRVHKYAIAIMPSIATPPMASRISGEGSGSFGADGKFGSGSGSRRSGGDAAKEVERAWRKAALSSGWATPPGYLAEGDGVGADFEDDGVADEVVHRGDEDETGKGTVPLKTSLSPKKATILAPAGRHEGTLNPEDAKLLRFLDGKHCLDEMCIALRLSEGKVLERLRSGRFGEVVVFSK